MILIAALVAVAPLSEDRAVMLTSKAMETLGPAARNGCLAYEIEDSSPARFDIAVREIHDQRCGGDPAVMPVIERFRVGRSPLKLWRYDVVGDRYLPCRLTRAQQPVCTR